MTAWDLNTPPTWFPTAKATKQGWVNPTTGEILVAIKNLHTKGGAGDVLSVTFNAESYEQGDDLAVTVRFNEEVDVTAGAALLLTWDGAGGNFSVYAAAQANTNTVVFNKVSGLGSGSVIPSEAGNLSIGAQTISGTITDNNSAVKASGVLTGTENFEADDTVLLDAKTYTFKAELSDTNGYVLLGSSLAESLNNLVAAVNLGSGAGTLYAESTTLHPTVSAVQVDTTATFTAKTAGSAANSIDTVVTSDNDPAFDAETLENGADQVATTKTISAGIALAAGDFDVAAAE